MRSVRVIAPLCLALLTAAPLWSGCAEVGPPWERFATDGVAPRWGHAAAVDATRDRMLVVGGQNDRGELEEVLALDLGTFAWSRLSTTETPPARTDFAVVLDATRDRLITIGGRRDFSTSVNEIWALDLTTNRWSRLPSGPSPRHDIAAATDGRRAWVYGGAGELFQSLEDLWELDLETDAWRLLPAPGDHPSARTSYGMAFFEGALWLHGGHDVVTAFHDSWRYDLALERWTRVEAPGGSVAGAHFGHAFDPVCGAIVLSGGDNLDNFNVGLTDAFFLGAAPRFARLPASVLPPPRDHPSLVVDPMRHRLVLFGGGSTGDGLGTLSDAWVRDLDGCR